MRRWRKEGPLVPNEGTPDDAGVEQGSARRAISIWAAAFLYVLAMPAVGYLLATPVFLAVVLWLFSCRGLLLVALPLGFTVPAYLIFVKFLSVRLPTGFLDIIHVYMFVLVWKISKRIFGKIAFFTKSSLNML